MKTIKQIKERIKLIEGIKNDFEQKKFNYASDSQDYNTVFHMCEEYEAQIYSLKWALGVEE